jgi:hypothetical protein
MSIQTQLIWDWPMSDDDVQQIIAYKAELHAAGLKVGAEDERDVSDGPGENQKTIVITWADEDTANKWIEFLMQFNPVSAKILK